jgi:hypothetical protein
MTQKDSVTLKTNTVDWPIARGTVEKQETHIKRGLAAATAVVALAVATAIAVAAIAAVTLAVVVAVAPLLE